MQGACATLAIEVHIEACRPLLGEKIREVRVMQGVVLIASWAARNIWGSI